MTNLLTDDEIARIADMRARHAKERALLMGRQENERRELLGKQEDEELAERERSRPLVPPAAGPQLARRPGGAPK